MRTIDTKKVSTKVAVIQAKFASLIVGQGEATTAITNLLEKYLSGAGDPDRPIGSVLFLGPTGTGKTAVVEAFTEGITGSSRNMIKVDCAEFQNDHEIAKLIGSPPGYLGHRETPARFKNDTIVGLQTFDCPFTILLFDEIEKASDSLWNLLLGILDKGTLTLGDNSTSDFKKTIIFMTSNVGSRKISERGGLGFSPDSDEAKDEKDIKAEAQSAARAKFSPEFLNRLDEIVVFNTLTREQIEEIMGMELKKIQNHIHERLGTSSFVFTYEEDTVNFLTSVGTSMKYGARELKRAMGRYVLNPLADDFVEGKISSGSIVKCKVVENDHIEWDITDAPGDIPVEEEAEMAASSSTEPSVVKKTRRAKSSG